MSNQCVGSSNAINFTFYMPSFWLRYNFIFQWMHKHMYTRSSQLGVYKLCVCMYVACVCVRCRRLSFVAFAFPFPIFFAWLFFSSVPCLFAVAALCLLSFLNAFTARLFIFPLLQIHQVYSTHSPDDKSICVPRWLSGKLYCINCAKAVTPLNLVDLYKCLCALDRFYIKTHL